MSIMILCIAFINSVLCLHCFPQHDRFLFHLMNSIPLAASFGPSTLKVPWDKRGRNFGANPRAFKVLLNDFGYDIVHCDSTGVVCIFVLSSILPKVCPTHFTMPSFSYPLFRAIDMPSDSPLVVTPELMKRLKYESLQRVLGDHDFIESLTTDNYLHERLSLWRTNYQKFESEEEFFHMTSYGRCLVDHNCPDVSSLLIEKLEIFNNHSAQLLHESDGTLSAQSVSEHWICSSVDHFSWVLIGALCAEIADLYAKQFLFLVDIQHMKDEWEELLQEGLKFNSHNPAIKAVYRYLNWGKYVLDTKSYQKYMFSYTFIGGIEKSAGLGVGICDNFQFRVYNDRVFHPLSSAMNDRLFQVEQPFISHFFPERQYSAHRYASALSREVPVYSVDETVLALIPPGFRDSAILAEVKNRLEDICALRSIQKAVLVFGPELSGTEYIQELYKSTQVRNNLSTINTGIIHDVGCEGGFPYNELCRENLMDLAKGFLFDIPNKDDDYWHNLTQTIYQRQLLEMNQETLVLADPNFSFTAPVWQGPLGNVDVVITTMSPAKAVYCLSRSKQISLDIATSRWLFYFTSALTSSLSYDNIHLLEYDPSFTEEELVNSLRRIAPLSHLLRNSVGQSDISSQSDNGLMCDLSTYKESVIVLPDWVMPCYDAMLNRGVISPDLCLANL